MQHQEFLWRKPQGAYRGTGENPTVACLEEVRAMCGSKDPNNKNSTVQLTTAAPEWDGGFSLARFLVQTRKKNNHTMSQTTTASIRILADNPNHHLWNNNGTFWCHYTLHLPDYTKRRVRQSLGTPHLERARKLRDQLLRRAVRGGVL